MKYPYSVIPLSFFLTNTLKNYSEDSSAHKGHVTGDQFHVSPLYQEDIRPATCYIEGEGPRGKLA
jgi:hypothetical protein